MITNANHTLSQMSIYFTGEYDQGYEGFPYAWITK